MTDDGPWIIVPNWEKFQHYTDRTPPWIKLYLELEHKPEWLDLTDTARGLLARIWVQYASSRGLLNVIQVRNLGWSRHHAGILESLNHAGFIQLSASKPLALEKRREEKNTRARARGQNHPAPSTPRTPTNGPDRLPIGDVLRDLAADSPFAASFLTEHTRDTDGRHDDDTPPADEQGRLEDDPGYF